MGLRVAIEIPIKAATILRSAKPSLRSTNIETWEDDMLSRPECGAESGEAAKLVVEANPN